MRFPISKEHQSSSSDSLILFLIYVVNALFLVLVVFLPSGFSKLNNHTLKPLYLLLQESTIETGICYLRLKSTKNHLCDPRSQKHNQGKNKDQQCPAPDKTWFKSGLLHGFSLRSRYKTQQIRSLSPIKGRILQINEWLGIEEGVSLETQ